MLYTFTVLIDLSSTFTDISPPKKPDKMMTIRKKLLIIFSIGLVLTIIGLTTGILWFMIYSSILNTQLSLTPTSTSYKLWEITPIPMYLKIYMFNLTNYEDFISNNESKTKPNFVEMGPYVFREVDYKVEQKWHDNDTITYQRKRVWHFDKSLSKGDLNDKVTNINPVTASVGYALRHKKPILRDIVDRVMKSVGQQLIITKSVNELLFEGYEDTMLKIAQKINFTEIPFTRFAWFYGRNGSASYDGTFNMLTGKSNLLDVGIVKEWNFNNRVSYYPGECGEIRGTNGDLWPPLPDNKTVSFFVPDICTSMSVTYDNTTIHEGLIGAKYISDDTIFDNGSIVPSRSCYCEGECVPSGALNISLCKWGAPAFISLPHFYLADPSYRENINGMKPSKEKHELSISIEPKTGVPLYVHAQLQLNLLMQPDHEMSMFKNIKKTFIPMLWFTQEAYLTSNYAHIIKFIIILESLGSITCYGIACIGILIISTGIFLYIKHGLGEEENQVLLSNKSNENDDISTVNE
ncbi:protein croquemort-like isoform X1 [Bombus bifarius]|uniref:Protein croquemort-like isoform X1 n=2 Tax=Bombus bifarius TaxID=103933 RepID=A0A6P8MGJ2_9HYME|nr:protein croquemort-like isoform X1 [Bombus bifarius]